MLSLEQTLSIRNLRSDSQNKSYFTKRLSHKNFSEVLKRRYAQIRCLVPRFDGTFQKPKEMAEDDNEVDEQWVL